MRPLVVNTSPRSDAQRRELNTRGGGREPTATVGGAVVAETGVQVAHTNAGGEKEKIYVAISIIGIVCFHVFRIPVKVFFCFHEILFLF